MPSHDCSHLIWDQFEEKSRGFADRIAVSSAAGDITFGRLYADAGSLAERLARVPIRPGSIACHTMKNGVEFVMAYLALCKLSAAVALVPEKFRKQDIRSLTEALEPHCFITNESLYAAIGRELPEAKSLAVPIDGGSEAVRVVIPPAADDRPHSPHPAGDRPDEFGPPVA